MPDSTHCISLSLDGLRPGNSEKILQILIEEFREENLSEVKRSYESLSLNIEASLSWSQTPEAFESFLGGLVSEINPENIFIYMDIDEL